MKILYDNQIFNMQRFGGISRYFVELFDGSPELFEVALSLRCSDNLYLLNSRRLQGKIREIAVPSPSFCGGFSFPGKSFLLHLRNKYHTHSHKRTNRLHTETMVREGDFDLFHPTYYSTYYLEPLRDKPLVLTVHDMIHELFPDDFRKRNLTARWKKELAVKAARIIAISENTKRDMVRLLDLPTEKIDVIPHGCSLRRPDASENAAFARKTSLPSRYILFTGSRKTKYKNFLPFLNAIADRLREERDLYLVCTGEPFRLKEIARFDMLGIRSKVRHYEADDAMLAYLYSKATLFAFPSLYEGFGLPILEAFECGCPAVLSNTSSFPEVAAEAAVYFDPNNTESMREAVVRTLDDPDLRQHLIAAGAERTKRFSWKKTVALTAETYRAAIHAKNSGYTENH